MYLHDWIIVKNIISGLKISNSMSSVKMSGVFQNGSDILKIMSDGLMFI